MKRNYTITGSTPIVEYEVSSKGIRHIRTTMPGKKPKEAKPSKGDNKKRDQSE